MKTYLEMNEKVADILQHGGKIEQYAAQYIEELRKENAELKHRAEVAEKVVQTYEEVIERAEKNFWRDNRFYTESLPLPIAQTSFVYNIPSQARPTSYDYA
mgnify:CR=1 FL=1